MDESGNHHSQQINIRIENQTPHVLPYRRVMNNENTWTQGMEHHTLGSFGGEQRRDRVVGGGQGGITWGEIPDVGDRVMEAAKNGRMWPPGALL